jgi:hypothetical protein
LRERLPAPVILAEGLCSTVLVAAATSFTGTVIAIEAHDRRLGERIEMQLEADDRG